MPDLRIFRMGEKKKADSSLSPRPNYGGMRIQPGDVILTGDLLDTIISALYDVAQGVDSEKQQKCRKIADNLVSVFGR